MDPAICWADDYTRKKHIVSGRQQRPDPSGGLLLGEQLRKLGGEEECAGAEATGGGSPAFSWGAGPGAAAAVPGLGDVENFPCTASASGSASAGPCGSPGKTRKGLNAFLVHSYELLSVESDFMHRNSDCSNCRLPLDINYYVNPAD